MFLSLLHELVTFLITMENPFNLSFVDVLFHWSLLGTSRCSIHNCVVFMLKGS